MRESNNAFPERCDSGYDISGLSKRELFAAMAMQGMIADSTVDSSGPAIAKFAVEYADELIAELNKGESKE